MMMAGGALLCAQDPSAAGSGRWQQELGGYYKALFSASKTYTAGRGYGDLMNRLRLSYDARYGEWFQAHVDFDNQAHFGNLIGQPEFSLVRDRQQGAWADLQHIYVDREHAYWDTSLYRGYVTLRSGPAALTLGRQRIGWGTARFWSPADVFNPLNPLQIEADERQGVDGALLEWELPHGLTWSGVYLPQNIFRRSTVATRLATNLAGYDVAGFFGRFERDWMGGAEFAGQAGGAGLRGEMTYRRRAPERPEADAVRLTFGADYAFPNTFYLVGEYFYNQGQPVLGAEFDPASLLRYTSEIFTLHRHFLSGGVGYDITPLVRAEAYTVADVAGGSVFFMPLLRYNVTPNTDLSIGAQFFASRPGGEFDRLANLFFVELAFQF